VWKSGKKKCLDGSTCEAKTKKTCSDVAGCTYNRSTGDCALIKDIPCSDYINYKECTNGKPENAFGCKWTQTTKSCANTNSICEGKPKTSCNKKYKAEGCLWNRKASECAVAKEIPCADYTNYKECVNAKPEAHAMGCGWTHKSKTCENSTCEMKSKKICANFKDVGCLYNRKKAKCAVAKDIPCTDYTKKRECKKAKPEASPAGCAWSGRDCAAK